MADVVATTCPECGGWVELDELAVGVEVDCLDCGAPLLLLEVEPLTLAMTADPDELAYPQEEEPPDG